MSSAPSSANPDQQAAAQPPSFKEQLDHKAHVARNPNYGKEQDQQQPGLLEKGNYSSPRPH
jgi:hypothetical protein